MIWYTNKITEYKTKHAAALEVGEDKEAAAHKLAYESYEKMAKQVK